MQVQLTATPSISPTSPSSTESSGQSGSLILPSLKSNSVQTDRERVKSSSYLTIWIAKIAGFWMPLNVVPNAKVLCHDRLRQ